MQEPADEGDGLELALRRGEDDRVDLLAVRRTRRVERRADGGATFVWEGVDLPNEPAALVVRATVRLAAEGDSLSFTLPDMVYYLMVVVQLER